MGAHLGAGYAIDFVSKHPSNAVRTSEPRTSVTVRIGSGSPAVLLRRFRTLVNHSSNRSNAGSKHQRIPAAQGGVSWPAKRHCRRRFRGVLDRAAERYAASRPWSTATSGLNFAELRDAADEVTRALIASGVDAGDRMAIWAPNIAEWVITSLGAHRAGAVVVTLNTRFKGSEAAYVLQRSEARLLFTVTDFLDTDYVEMLGDRGRGTCESRRSSCCADPTGPARRRSRSS